MQAGFLRRRRAEEESARNEEPPVAEATPPADFYTHTNKDWLQANPATTGSISALSLMSDRALQQQRDLLDNAMRMPQGGVQKLLGDFWASGLDETASEADGSNSIAPLLTRINAIRRSRDVPAAIAALHQVGIPVAFNFSADVDLNDLSRHIGYFSQGGIGLPDPAYYTRTDADTRALLGRYNNYVQKILTLTGTPADKAAAEAQAVIDLETRIAQSSRPLVALRDPRGNYAPVAVDTLGATYKQLQLVDFLKAQGVADDTVSMSNPELFAQLNALVGSLKRPVETYLRYRSAMPWRRTCRRVSAKPTSSSAAVSCAGRRRRCRDGSRRSTPSIQRPAPCSAASTPGVTCPQPRNRVPKPSPRRCATPWRAESIATPS